ncbi:nucleotidyltransferase family protein [Candidatus Nitronereus thalassa]|uniref:Nucleotidyltransferase family protein n=1 Tax=Candidatus Nitronereus thalassa TaxID=3020898 RepID=A0ABU3KC57_9BACT|nr:nucleotidyltransferase family protein [Candidatus Nitronereus thalassa]MDT7044105.1 nucleotidyltransferase family protein [Candidatus Nitronereus thalassa]
MITLETIKTTLQAHKEELSQKYGVKQIGVFGSCVKNEQLETSDVDLLVEFDKAIDLFIFVNLKNYLSDLLNANVDLVMKKALKPKIGQRILQEVVEI